MYKDYSDLGTEKIFTWRWFKHETMGWEPRYVEDGERKVHIPCDTELMIYPDQEPADKTKFLCPKCKKIFMLVYP